MATRLVLVAVGLAASVLVARSLGPEGRGLQAAIATITALGVQFGNLGLHASNTYYVAKQRDLLPTLVGNSLLVSFGMATTVLLAVWGLSALWPGIFPLSGPFLALALAGIPLGLGFLLLENLLIGIQEIRAYNKVELGTRLLYVGALGSIAMSRHVSVELVAILGLVVSAVSCVWVLFRLRPYVHASMKPALGVLTGHLHYGFRAYVAAFFAYTVIRVDILMCTYLLDAEPTGQYSIAVSMADLVYMLPVIAGTIAFPRLVETADPAERWAKARSITKWVALVMILVAVVAALLARPLVLLLFGRAFLPAVSAFLWLLPGIVLLGVNTILMNYFAAEGMPPIAIWSPGLASAANLALNFALLPALGIIGASIASTVAYGLMFVFTWIYLLRTRR